VKVNGFFVKGMSSLTDNFDSIFVGTQDVKGVTLNAPHLPYSISMIVWCHTNKAVKWSSPLRYALVIIANANEITEFHVIALNPQWGSPVGRS
jgi:hypothetical protein